LFAGKSFIGRTYVGRLMELDDKELHIKATEHSNDAVDWVIFNSKVKDPKLKCAIEFSLLVKKTVNRATEVVKRYGIGYLVVPVFSEEAVGQGKVYEML